MRWQLPPWRGHAYLHTDLINLGRECCWADEAYDEDLQAFNALRDKWTAFPLKR